MVTVFTSAYNRAYLMETLYFSLLRQRNFNFEWIIIDDASTDNISELAEKWIKETKQFEIRYHRMKKNGGKHKAMNKALQLARGQAFFIIDSDDYATDNAIEDIEKWYREIITNSLCAGVAGTKVYPNGKTLGGEPLFNGYIDANNFDRDQYNLSGDKAEVYKTELLRKYPFPEIEGENFMAEGIIWENIAADGYWIRWYNTPISICEYRSDGLTAAGISIYQNNPIGWAKYLSQSIKFNKKRGDKKFELYSKFYMCERYKYSIEEMAVLLETDLSIIQLLDRIFMEMIGNYINKYGKHIAIYGMGQRGTIISEALNNTEIIIDYIIDKKIKHTQYPFYDMKTEKSFPLTGAIIVSLKENAEEVRTEIMQKTGNNILLYNDCLSIAQKLFDEGVERV